MRRNGLANPEARALWMSPAEWAGAAWPHHGSWSVCERCGLRTPQKLTQRSLGWPDLALASRPCKRCHGPCPVPTLAEISELLRGLSEESALLLRPLDRWQGKPATSRKCRPRGCLGPEPPRRNSGVCPATRRPGARASSRSATSVPALASASCPSWPRPWASWGRGAESGRRGA
ncbi:unnamed protein product [Prorocentrum cordatum]|uniref:Uncharacterized protein n=1 Tax=Prorocentrum cordatum TaxID=2364126 RepID=A0ABN9W0K9_9DINO|nr:unnamed protein product [Polarella glacialis]